MCVASNSNYAFRERLNQLYVSAISRTQQIRNCYRRDLVSEAHEFLRNNAQLPLHIYVHGDSMMAALHLIAENRFGAHNA
jgi:hypothetical protein